MEAAISTSADLRPIVANLITIIERNRFPLHDEIRTQTSIEIAFNAAAVIFTREERLSESDIVDFLCDGGIACEVKIKGRRMAIYRQLERYAQHENVRAILLVTALPMGLPEFIKGKPTFIASLNQGWL